MNPSVALILEVAVVLTICATIQSTVGFAFGLFAIPPLVWLKLELPAAITLVLTASFIQTCWATCTLRTDIRWRPALMAMTVRGLTLPIGVGLLQLIAVLDRSQVGLILGAVLLVIVAILWLWQVEPADRLHPGWGWLAFSVSGLMLGSLGMGAPPMVVWVMAHNWTSRQMRAFLLLNMLVCAPIQLLLMSLTFSGMISKPLLLGLALSPAVLVGTKVGLGIGQRLSRRSLQALAYGLLVVIAIGSMVGPLIR